MEQRGTTTEMLEEHHTPGDEDLNIFEGGLTSSAITSIVP